MEILSIPTEVAKIMKTHSLAARAMVLFSLWLPAAFRAQASVDYGNASSATLTAKAWTALGVKNYADTIAYTSKCIDLYKTLALQQQKNLLSKYTSDKANWALNDVATCYYIEGMAKEASGKKSEAMADYKFVVDNLNMAQCDSGNGTTWNPAKPCKERLALLALDNTTPATIEKIDLDSITVKSATAISTYRITGETKIDFKGEPANLTDIRPGMAVTVTAAANPNEAASISVSDPPRKN